MPQKARTSATGSSSGGWSAAPRAACRWRGVRIQIWLATETGSESDNRTSVRTDNAGRYRVETAPTIAQFGEPNIHVGYDDGKYESVFIRRVVDLEDDTATIDLNLQPTP